MSSKNTEEILSSGSDQEGEDDSILDTDSDDEFEDQGSSDDDEINDDDDEEVALNESDQDSEEDELINKVEIATRNWNVGKQRTENLKLNTLTPSGQLESQLHIDDLSDDDEDAEGNTIGRVPLHWYDAYDHLGYNIAGEKILKPKMKDSLDHAIENKDDPHAAAHTVYDMYNGRYVHLSERDIEIIRRVQTGAFAHPEHNDTPDYIDYYSSIIEEMPIRAAPEPKRRFITSKWETMKVLKIMKAIKEGRYIFSNEKTSGMKKDSGDTTAYMIWDETEDDILSDHKKNRFHLPAPKVPLPGHAESYNPPSEYLLSSDEIEQMKDLPNDEKEYNFIPTKYSSLRHVKGYENFIKERFERCLDLYLCPRKLKRRLNINPETLVPKLPKPKELKPFPNGLSLQFLGHTKNVRSLTVSPDGQYLVSGSDDGTVRLWEVDTSLCRNSWKFPDPVIHVTWNPNPQHHLVAVATGNKIILIATGTGDHDSEDILDSFLAVVESSVSAPNENEEKDESDSDEEAEEEEEEKKGSIPASKKDRAKLNWQSISPSSTDSENTKKRNQSDLTAKFKIGPRAQVVFPLPVSFMVWHYRGDYLGVLSPLAATHAISVHQVNGISYTLILTHLLSPPSSFASLLRSRKVPLNSLSIANPLAL
jgi:ribosome biogenesis protein ERB1